MPTRFRLSRWIDSQGLALALALLVAPVTLWAQSEDEGEDTAPLTADDFANVEEVEVIGTLDTGDNASELERFSVAITDSISIEDLLRFGDSDVASALKRIVGVAVTGGKYANIRGLDGRYISSTLNGALMPSTDPFRRDVQLDLFPSEILGGIDIQKSYTSDLPGDTTGGVIRMSTRDAADAFEASIGGSLGFVSGVTGQDVLLYEGGGSDFLGFDDGTRELPGAIRDVLGGGNFRFSICQIEGQSDCVPRDEAARLAGLLPNNYAPRNESAAPALGLALSYGDARDYASGSQLGWYTSWTYDQGFGSRQDAVIDDFNEVGTYEWGTYQVKLNGYLAGRYRAASGWELRSKTMLLRDTEDRASVVDVDIKGEDFDEVTTVLEWVERQFIGQQFQADIPVFNNHQLGLRLGVTQTNRYAPDRREYLYRGGQVAVSNVERSFADLTEDGLDIGFDYALPWSISDSVFAMVRFGAVVDQRDRDNELIRLGIRRGQPGLDLRQDIETVLDPQNFVDDFWRLNTNTTATTDTYAAAQDSTALYLSTEFDFGTAWSLTTGVRMEQYDITLRYPNEPNANADRKSDDVLPGVVLTWRLRDDIQFRTAYGRTVSRPNITELANSRFFDSDGRLYIGCPNCLDATVDNIDLRAEWYYAGSDSLSLALFTKRIDQPLERAIADGSGSATNAFTFRNGDAADVTGIEIDGSWRAYDGIDITVDVSGNIAFIESEIELSAESARLEVDPQRELQGQSPFLANLQIALDDYERDQKLTLVLNHFDDRVFAAARSPQPTFIESARLDINLNYEKSFRNGTKASLKLKNLLDEPIEYTQGGRVAERYTRGMGFSLGISRDF
ncbi:MAG: TonB-dependent receptor [Oceanococcaceae bacterium]